MRYYTTTKKNLFHFLNKIKWDCKEFRLIYDSTGNDVFNPCGTEQKQTKYDLTLFTDQGHKILILKQHRNENDFNFSEKIKDKYFKWIRDYVMQSNPTT